MTRDVVIFSVKQANIGLFAVIAFARHPCPAVATQLFVPSAIWVVFADPPYAETYWTHLIHGIEARGPPLQDRGHTARPPCLSLSDPIPYGRRQLNCRPF
jgi:hypothetical protein